MTTVLIVDDEFEVGRSLSRVLTRAGYQVTVMTSGVEAVATFAQSPADVVITDIIMPKVHGIELIKAIREKGATTRIIAISGGGNFGPLGYEPGAITTQAYLAAALKAGANEVLMKPFDLEDLLSSVRRLLGH